MIQTNRYTEFAKLPIDKMAQSMSDMTYIYKRTEVPKSHYKKLLDETCETILPIAVEHKLLDVYIKTIKQILEDSPILFLKALVCIEKKINPTNIRPQELEALQLLINETNEMVLNKTFISDMILGEYDNIINNPNDYIDNNDINNIEIEITRINI